MKSMQLEKIKEIKDAKRKVHSYAKYVKEMHYPRINTNEKIMDSIYQSNNGY